MVFSTIAIAAAIVLFASGPLVATHQAQAQFRCGFGHDCDVNPTTGNPHPPSTGNDPNTQTGTETGNPHNSAGCTGDPHGERGTDACHGSQ
jgi:hypothetical protein